ncbi:MAG: M50 family metallopeptidase [Candidatus Diapherotrites archaeon]|uniref:Zinc metalloprotease n=1 Tax=Candidatus Iainarchaeum sp. TaxID=3101447 RepID=A0A939CA32_9ARCH|nr:M50 family metallopeptidase [Candidatus Diapherotrites archaeon]
MRSVKLGKLFGVKVELHSTFVWLGILVAALLALFQPENFLPIMILLFLLFLSVFFHELVHSLVAMQKGCKVEKIILLPIGGLSVSEELPEKPMDEFQIAVAGPLFNFVIVAAIIALASIVKLPFPENWLSVFVSSPIEFEEMLLSYPLLGLFYVNLLLGAFNLFLPALPLDGGRVARSILASVVGFGRATLIITRLSVFFAIFLFMFGFFTGSILIAIIAVFIYFGAKQEQETAAIKQALEGQNIKALVNRKPFSVKGTDSIEKAAGLMEKRNELYFLARLEKGGFGFIDIDAVAAVGEDKWKQTTVEKACKKLKPAKEGEEAGELAVKMLGKGIPLLPVSRNGKFAGIIEARELRKRFELEKALKKN